MKQFLQNKIEECSNSFFLMAEKMKSMYDFILFENYHLAKHHNYDVILIARLLKHSGRNVAILDVYNEDNVAEIDGIPVLKLNFKIPIPNDKWNKNPKNKLHSLFATVRFLWQQHWYFKKVVKEISNKAERFYCGSYHVAMSSVLLDMKKPCYFWGLRSSRMTGFGRHIQKNPVMGVKAYLLSKMFFRRPNLHLFVSNEIIRKEFLQLGVPEHRLHIREERCINTIPPKNEIEPPHPEFTLLTIGLLRPDKRVEYTVSEFLDMPTADFRLVLAGRSSSEKYETVIQNKMKEAINVIRINRFLNYEDFNQLMTEAHFVVLADKQQATSVTNGTMLEALINIRPIIAPDYNPYKYYVGKYNIGILYNPEIKGDMQRAFMEAKQKGYAYYVPYVLDYLQTIQFDEVARKLEKSIYDE